MNLNNISLPYPVLGISDDITTSLPDDAISINIDKDVINYMFDINLKFNNNDIKYLIKTGFAEYSCEYLWAQQQKSVEWKTLSKDISNSEHKKWHVLYTSDLCSECFHL